MSNRTKQRRSGGLTLLLYQRTLHPELFNILASEKVSRRAYDADVWLVEGGHVISLTAGKNTLTEVIVTSNDPMTDRGLLQGSLNLLLQKLFRFGHFSGSAGFSGPRQQRHLP